MKFNKLLILIVYFGILTNSYSQSSNLEKVKSIEYYYQKCLDQGTDMLGCSNKYYFFCDKLLNETYQAVRKKISQNEKELLKSEQLKWIQKRDIYFKKVYIDAKEEAEDLPDKDLQMIFIDKKADYVKNRIVFLTKKYKV